MEWLEDMLEDARLDLTEEENRFWNPDLEWMEE